MASEVEIRTAIIVLAIVAVVTAAGTYYAITSGVAGPSVTGFITGTATVNVSETVSIAMVKSTVSFENMDVGQTNNTGDDLPNPFVVRNDGNLNTNITCSATSIWSTDASPTTNYQWNSSANESGSLQNNVAGANLFAYQNMPTTATKCVGELKFADANDQATVNINLTVPGAESAGNKTSTVTFTGSKA